MNFTPIQQRDLSFHVYVQIREMILSGDLNAGEKLPQEKIAAQLGVSRTPLHKAFIMPEEKFLVESIPRRDNFIRKPDIRSIMDAFECCEGLEGVAARRAAENFTDEEINELEEMFVPFRNQQEIVQYDYQMADQAFHEAIIAASGNLVIYIYLFMIPYGH
jgi:DNA-binding GntR family transcriptional regulator